MVGWLVEDEQVGLRDDGAAQGDAPFFSAAQCGNVAIRSGTLQLRHRGLDVVVDAPAVEARDVGFEFGVLFGISG